MQASQHHKPYDSAQCPTAKDWIRIHAVLACANTETVLAGSKPLLHQRQLLLNVIMND